MRRMQTEARLQVCKSVNLLCVSWRTAEATRTLTLQLSNQSTTEAARTTRRCHSATPHHTTRHNTTWHNTRQNTAINRIDPKTPFSICRGNTADSTIQPITVLFVRDEYFFATWIFGPYGVSSGTGSCILGAEMMVMMMMAA